LNGATTVAGTVTVAHAVGIKVFVTGDILVNSFALGFLDVV
jgi:pseudouridine-5'-phosphate glycosidase